jgi:hypothetical protein
MFEAEPGRLSVLQLACTCTDKGMPHYSSVRCGCAGPAERLAAAERRARRRGLVCGRLNSPIEPSDGGLDLTH